MAVITNYKFHSHCLQLMTPICLSVCLCVTLWLRAVMKTEVQSSSQGSLYHTEFKYLKTSVHVQLGT